MIGFLEGVVLGLTLAAPPGPITALMAQEAVKRPRNGSYVGAGAMTADTTFFALSRGVLYLVKPYLNYFYAMGGAFMFVFAYQALQKAKPLAKGYRSGYLKGLAVGLTNPFQVGWWLTAGLSLLNSFGIASVLGLFTALGCWILFFPLAVNVLGKFGGPSSERVIRLLSAAALVAFGAYFLIRFFEAVGLPYLCSVPLKLPAYGKI